MKRHLGAALAVLLCWSGMAQAEGRIVVASKRFNESYILAEMMCQLLETGGFSVERRFGLGGTLVCFEAISHGEIDVYPEYSGTLEQAVLKSDRRIDYDELASRLRKEYELELLSPFGFNNTYAIAVRQDTAKRLHLRTIGDLAARPELRFAFTHEFLNRKDGWPGVARTYGLTATPVGIEHELAYEAMSAGRVDVTDVYSTDGDIEMHHLVLLEDDKGFFPSYLAAPLVRASIDGAVRDRLNALAGRIDDETMRHLNALVIIEGKTFAEVAHGYLQETGLVEGGSVSSRVSSFWPQLLRRTITHLKLTFIALLAGIFIAVPLGAAVFRTRRLARPVIYIAGILQTIPSIALLALMIPLFGIGATPAIVALFLYALLPILRNTAAALFSIDPVLRRVAVGMGLNGWQRLRHVEIPLATPTILAGIKTAAVINIGTATLAAFIGAGGLGEPIVTGLALNNTGLILEGAIPAAILAVLTELLFELLERAVVPRHLSSRIGQ
jgi:osmoprotectant transport system permease protein